MSTQYQNMLFDMCVHAFSQCDANDIKSYEKALGLRYYRNSLSAIEAVRRLVFNAEGYDDSIVKNFGGIIKWMHNRESDAIWVARMALKQKKELQKLERKELEFNCPDTSDTSFSRLSL